MNLTSSLPTLWPVPEAALREDIGLAEHVQQCRQARGRWFAPAMWVERAHGWVAPRFVTTIALASIALVGLSQW